MKTRSQLIFFCIIILCLTSVHPIYSQTTGQQNFSDIRVDDLGDAKIRDFMNGVETSGLSLNQIEQIALAKGMKPAEVKKLRQRVDRLRLEDARTLRDGRLSTREQDSILRLQGDTLTGFRKAQIEDQAGQALRNLRTKIFGLDIFRNNQLVFEPNTRIAPPDNYRVGPDDEILVDIFGYSEANYIRTVNAQGTITIPYGGVMKVVGLTLPEIEQKLKSKLSGIYTGMKSGTTFLRVTIGRLRSIKVTVIGEVNKPGSYTLSSLSPVFNALYASGGPNENGSFREIEIIRGNRIVAKLDVYDFLLHGIQKDNIRLEDQDIIRVPVYKVRVEFSGEVKRPAFFEVLESESLSDVLSFAGGFSDQAYTGRIKVLQNTTRERKVTDVFQGDFSSYKPRTGDKYFAEPIIERFENRVNINGAVFRPGQYEVVSGLTLGALIKKADGLKEDAFLPRGFITRLKDDNNTEIISFDLGAILNGSSNDIPLKREDIVTISSKLELRDEYTVRIDGEVRSPGIFNYSENMTLEDLILQAGGLNEGASITRVEVARRVNNSNKDLESAKSAEIFQIDIDPQLSLSKSKFVLQPFDIVSVRRSEGYEVQKQVKIEGEVKYPGIYFINLKNERISDLIKRAGGLTVFAYPKGASLQREFLNERERNEAAIAKKKKLEEEKTLITLNRLRIEEPDSLDKDTIERNNLVGIDLQQILNKPTSQPDLFLEEGDVIYVPKQLQTVKVTGNVLLPVTSIYAANKGFKSYVSEGGGFMANADRRRSYVKYSNGSVRSTRKSFLFFNNYPKVTPGAEIVVPISTQPRKISVQELVGISTGLVSLAVLVISLLR